MRRNLLDPAASWIVLGALAVVCLLNIDTLGSDPWRFRPGAVRAHGPLASLVRAAGRHWDPSLLRSVAMLAGLGVVVLAFVIVVRGVLPAWVAIAASAAVAVALVLPGTLLQAGLRQSTSPWFFTNDSTYQIELAGEGVLHRDDPYGRDYSHTGLERFYSLDGSVHPGTLRTQVALHHFAYFPGTALLAAAWHVLPRPWDDFRVLIALCTLGLLASAFAFPGPLPLRAALGVLAAANPIAVRAAWFGTADAPAVLLLLLAFAAAMRRRPVLAGLLIGGAVLTKQFALAGVPFLGVLLLLQVGRAALLRATVAAVALFAIGVLPFVVAGPSAFWHDTVSYGSGTYRIVGYGLSALLVKAGVLHDRHSSYPFLPLVVLAWLPVTVVLAWHQWRARSAYLAGACFAASIFLLLFLGRVFQISYLIWPLEGLVLAGLLGAPQRRPT
ncbi:MAG TPA: glycosyltransferase 87 family protein [Gaiellaceae bacterium]|nr:glycosyltransferase 87 family protein [Gaiellaceae bacterium]